MAPEQGANEFVVIFRFARNAIFFVHSIEKSHSAIGRTIGLAKQSHGVAVCVAFLGLVHWRYVEHLFSCTVGKRPRRADCSGGFRATKWQFRVPQLNMADFVGHHEADHVVVATSKVHESRRHDQVVSNERVGVDGLILDHGDFESCAREIASLRDLGEKTIHPSEHVLPRCAGMLFEDVFEMFLGQFLPRVFG